MMPGFDQSRTKWQKKFRLLTLKNKLDKPAGIV